MLNMLIGAPGGGKSYEAVVYHVLPALRAGRLVITNLPILADYLFTVMPEAEPLLKLVHPTKENPRPFSTMADYGDDWRHPDSGIGPLYVIDECHKALPLNRTDKLVEEWFAEHRHELADVLLLTQNYGKISRDIRDLTQLLYRCRKAVALGSSSSYIRKVQDGLRGEVVNQTVRSYKPEFFKFYRSHTHSNEAAKEAFASDMVPVWRHWSFIGAGVFLSVAVVLAFMGYLNPFRQPETKPATVAAAPKITALPSVQPSQARQPEPKPAPVSQPTVQQSEPHPYGRVGLHLAGFLQSESGRYLYNIVASQNGQRVFDLTTLDLDLAGYVLYPKGACLLEIHYQGFVKFLTCDAPAQGVSMPRPVG